MVQIKGNQRMFRKFILLIVSMVGFFSTAVMAVGLGESELYSGHNQQLKAVIKLLSVEDYSEHELHLSLASAQEFDKLGVERLFFLNDIRFKTVRDENGDLIVRLSTHDTIKEPFLNFVVALNYPKGRFVKEYTFLLDPPIFEESTSSTIEKTTSSAQRNEQIRPAETRNIRQTSNTEKQTNFTGSSYGPVSASDTLWSIASKVRPNSDVSIHQTLVAIYRANPHAFANGNINNLLRGEVLQIPDAGDISQVPHRAALQDVSVQNKQWQSGGSRQIIDNTGSRSSSGEYSSQGRLSLATPDSEADAIGSGASGTGDGIEDTRQQLLRSQEMGATLQAENDELRARLADALEKLEQIQSNAAVNITDAEAVAITQAQREAEAAANNENDSYQQEGETQEEVVDVAGNEVEETDYSEDSSVSTDSPEAENEASSELGLDATADSEEAASETVEKPVTQSVPVQPAPVEKGFFDSAAVLWGSIIGLVVLISLAVFWRMRKRMEEEDFQDDLVASAGAGSIDTTETFELPDVGDDMLVELDMDDELGGDEGEKQQDENFDPLGEADIYIAYGKYEQAEKLLLEAIENNPSRSDLKMKLMECYVENEDKDSFERLAEDVSQAEDSEQWMPQVEEMRAQAWSGEEGETDEFDLPSTEDIFGDDDDSFEAELDSMMEESVLDENDDDIDISLDAESDFDNDMDEDSSEFDVDMDFALDDNEELTEASADAVTETFDSIDDELSLDDDALGGDTLAEDESDEFSLDIDDDEDEFSLDIDDNEDDLDLALDDDDDFSFDDDEGDDDDFSGIGGESSDEISTKLDLARAYIDMGDSEGAKEILAEVVAEGDEEQKSEAQALLDKAD